MRAFPEGEEGARVGCELKKGGKRREGPSFKPERNHFFNEKKRLKKINRGSGIN